MKRLFLVLLLFCLSSSHTIHKRSEDVDPLLKELFSEIKAPAPKDRRDSQTSGDDESSSGSESGDGAPELMDNASSGRDESGSGDPAGDTNEESGSGTDETQVAAAPANNDSPPAEKAESEKSGESATKSVNSASVVNTDKNSTEKQDALAQTTGVPTNASAEQISAVVSPGVATVSDLGVKKSEQSPESVRLNSTNDDNITVSDSNTDETPAAVDTDGNLAKSQDTLTETKTVPVKASAEQMPAVVSPGVATVNEQGGKDSDEVPGVTGSTGQSDHLSEGATATINPAVATGKVPGEKQDTSVPSGINADVTSDASQSENTQNTMESARANIPEGTANTGTVVPQSSNDVDMRSNIPEAPAAVTQPAWPALNQPSGASRLGNVETNEKQEFMRKDTIPAAPRQPGASSYPLQLNRHSPGAELIKRFFIAKQEAKKRKEEEAKQKSLIGDGKFTVSSNNGFYNYASAQQTPPPTLPALQENGKQGVCVDKYESCPEFAKNHYCTDYKKLMKVQCQKSCRFCDGDDEEEDDEDDGSNDSDNAEDDDDTDSEAKKKNNKVKNKDDEDDEDDDGKTQEESDEKGKQNDAKIEKDNNDDDDEDGVEDKVAESGDQHLDTEGSGATASDEGSGSASGSGSNSTEQFDDIDSNSSDSRSARKEDLPPTAEEFEEQDEEEKTAAESGSGSDSDDVDDDSDELAKDLAEQELFSNQNVKKDNIPNPSVPLALSPYPKIDLKDIARYVSLYRSVAKKLFGEALESAKKEFVAQQSKKSDIPVPIKEELKNSNDSSDSLEGFYTSQQQKKRNDIPMNPNNAVYSHGDETWANRAYKEAESYLRSKIPEFKNYAPPAMFNYPFYINDPNKTVEETNEGTSSKKSEIPESPEQKYNRTLQEILRRDHVNKPASDPYEYLRDMVPGSSMKPIASKNGISYVPDSYSRPVHLNTKSQWLDLMAKKKSAIPRVAQAAQARARSSVSRPEPAVPQMQTQPEALAAQMTQYKSSVPQTESADDVHIANAGTQTTNPDFPQPGVVRAEIPEPQPKMEQTSAAQNSNFLQSDEATGRTTDFGEIESRSKVSNNVFHSLPPLFHGAHEQRSESTKGFNLPPLNHAELPPLHHENSNPSNYMTSEVTKAAGKGAAVTAQYSNSPAVSQAKSPNPVTDKHSDKSLLNEKVSPVQDMQIGIPNAYSNPQKQTLSSQQVPLKAMSTEQTPKSRQFEDPKHPWPPQPVPAEGYSTQYTPPANQAPSPNQSPPPNQAQSGGTPVPAALPQNLLPANEEPAYVPEENYVVPVLKKNLIRPRPDMECQSGWQGASGDFGNFCYKVVFQRQTWQSARDSCKALNADLFSVKNAYEQRFVDGLARSPMWIGYQDKASDGTWSWSDGSTTVYTNWNSSSLRDAGQRADCVILDAEDGRWRDVPCKETHKFLCKRTSECDVKSGWKELTLSSLKGCYKMYDEKAVWDEASQTCNRDGGNLASILSNDEQIMISQVYASDNLWIGYNDRESEGDWTWTDKKTSSYTNWNEASPNNGGISCALVTAPSGTWRDESCKKKHDYICKRTPKGLSADAFDDTISPPVAVLLRNHTENSLLKDASPIGGSAPAVPVYFWPLLKTTNGQTRGTDHAEPHGNVRQVKGGIELNGVDAWLDGGDFHGKCFSNPELCIKGLSVAMQLNLDSSTKAYQDKHFVIDTSGDRRGVAVYIKNNSIHYRVTTVSKSWELATELMTNEWQDIVFTWKKEEGLTLYVNGAFKDSVKGGKAVSPVKDEQTHLLMGKSKDDAFTKMCISSLSVYPRVLTTENIPFVFTYDDTVLPSYRWLLSRLVSSSNRRAVIPTTESIKVRGFVKPVDGGLFVSADEESFIDAGDFNNECLSDPAKCQNGFSFSCKLKFSKVVRSYTERKYILDSGAGQDGSRGISAYIINNNLYFDLAMSTNEDTLRWTVRAPLYTIRWQRVALSWSLAKGLTLYMDGSFRGSTKLPKSVPISGRKSSSRFIIGKQNEGSAEFAMSSLAVYDRYLSDNDMSGLFGDKSMPYPGLIREIWRDIPGTKVSDLRSSAYYPNDPSDIQIIENFDAPFDLDKNYGTKVKGYFIPPESGRYTFFLSGSRSAELWISNDEHESGLKKIVSLVNGSAHNQWTRSLSQSSKPVELDAGRYYFVVAVQKGTTSSDSLSAGVKLPSGRFIRPLTKETLQWRRRGNHYSGLIREVWKDLGGYQVSDLTSKPSFPNNPSSVEVIDNFDAPFNVEDNYGSRVRGFFIAPETGHYRFYLAADSTGELWISSDESEANLRKMVSITGWTDHNEWLKYAEQKSEKVLMKKGKSYYITVYQKAEKLGDCASVAMEMPSGHFEGPIKQKHLSWKLPDGRTGPGPSSESSALPKPIGLFPLDNTFGAKDVINEEQVLVKQVYLTSGPDGRKTAYEFSGDKNSYIEIPKTNKLDTQFSTTILASIFPTGKDGPIVHYKSDTAGVHLWQFNENQLFVRFVRRDGQYTQPLAARVLQPNRWNEVGASYDNTTGVAQLWHDGKMVKSRNIGQIHLRTQFPIRLGAGGGDKRQFKGKISCIQIYDRSLTAEQVGSLRSCPVKGFNDGQDASGSGEENSAELTSPIALSVNQLQEEDTEDEIQGSDVTSANKCRPNPCQNDGRCVIDLKRMDGYRCRCTLDFAGRHCQVSKPEANSPVVKKTTIPRPAADTDPEEEGAENRQKIATTKKSKGKVFQDKKDNVYLLYQKIGCYQDNVRNRDLPKRPRIRAVTQEVCVRECALLDEGFSYFGLQDGTKCFCGKDYGKYGKGPEEKCNKRCRGNEDENCGGDKYNMVYFYGIGTNYTIRTYTGSADGAGTKANIYVTLFGDKGDSGFRLLTPGDKKYARGSVDTQVMALPDLGEIRKLRVLHDNSGSDPSWFLDKVIVEDERGKSYEFFCNQWLSDTQGGGRTERLLTLRKRKRSQH